MTPSPLHGCRVLDLGIITAGAATSALLADLGAEVIKVESPTYRDPFRGWPAGSAPARAASAMPPFFRSTNRNKAGISIDLKHPQGHAAFLKLVARSDVVVENFRRGVLARLGLDYPVLRAVNPNVVLASISSQGENGPDAGHVSYGTTLEAVGGLAWLTGYSDQAPVVTGRDLNYPDQVAAIFAAGMIATAWFACRAGAGGTHLDISQRELTSFLVGEVFAAGSEAAAPRSGNAQPPHLLQECFLAADGRWIAVTVDNALTPALARLLDLPCSATGDELHQGLHAWSAVRAGEVCVEALCGAGVAAALVHDGRTLLSHRGSLWGFALLPGADGGFLKGFPFQLTTSPLAIRRDAPAIGSDTADVLVRIGGYSVDDVAALAREGIIELAPP